MFELISQIPFHFATSLCPLMDPIYYVYHKLYHILADHVGHYNQVGARGTEQRRCWSERNHDSHAGPCLLFPHTPILAGAMAATAAAMA